ncbi:MULTISPECIES: Pycsar system effector family protein [Amycolatopsis]|uniref:Pycsar system effector family protein n=1 Tax=Amycolatopsis TaxID=1813 RepID=UPI00106FA826|nr:MULTISPECIES: Pycsar system effector family protein [Amycolatopsis]
MRHSRRKVPAGLSGRAEAELDIVLTTVSSFQGAVQHADDKARTLVSVLAMITAMATAQLGLLGTAHPPAVSRFVVTAVLVCFAAAYVFSAVHLVQAIWPRTGSPAPDNQFAFPSVAVGAVEARPRSVRDQRTQAGDLALLLARLAMRKHRHVRCALAGICVLLASGPGLLLLAALG